MSPDASYRPVAEDWIWHGLLPWMIPPRVCIAALSLAISLASAASVATAQRLSINRWAMQPLAVPNAIRDLPDFSDLEYDDTSHVVGMKVDLNQDGRPDYLIRSAESLCGFHACDFLIVDGATLHSLGIVSGGTFYFDQAPRGRFPTLHSMTSSSASTATWTEYTVQNGKYQEGASRELNESQIDSATNALKKVPVVKASEGRGVRPR